MGDTIARNRRAHHDYSIEDTFEAGIVLRGTEIKSIRDHKVSLADAYARIERDEAWIIGLHIAPWESTDVRFNHEPKRARKLLLHRREIDELLGKTKAKGLTIVPLSIYITAGQGEGGAGPRTRQADVGPAARDRGTRREAGHGRGRWRTPGAQALRQGSHPDEEGRCGSRGCSRRSTCTRRVSRGGSSSAASSTSPAPRCSRRCATSREHGDELRRLMLREPRGYPALCANVILPPTHPDADAGYVIMEQVEYPGMSGLEHDLRGHGPARDRHAADDGAGHGDHAGGAGRPDPRPRRRAPAARSPASRSATCRRSRPTWTRRSRSRSSAP